MDPAHAAQRPHDEHAQRRLAPTVERTGFGERRACAGAAAALRGAVALASVVVLNWRFYALLLRRRGPVEAAAGVFLHVLHYLACAVSVPIGLALHLRDARRLRHAPAADDKELSGAEDPVASTV